MKRKSKRLKYITIAKYAGFTALGIYLCKLGMDYAYAERGYFAYGGEYLLLLLPFVYYLFADIGKGIIEMFELLRSDDNE